MPELKEPESELENKSTSEPTSSYEIHWKSGDLGISFVEMDGNLVVDFFYISPGSVEGIHNVNVGDILLSFNGNSPKGKRTDTFIDMIENAKLPAHLVLTNALEDDHDEPNAKDQRSLSALSAPPLLPSAKKSLPLPVAILKGDVEATKTIVSKMSAGDIFVVDAERQQSILHLAVRSNRSEIVKLLCKLSVWKELMNLADKNGNTALHFAVGKSSRIVRILLTNGVSPILKNKWDHSPLSASILMAKSDVIDIPRLLLKTGAYTKADKEKALHQAVDLKLFKIAGCLVHYGAGMDFEDENSKMVFEKVSRPVLKDLISQIYEPPRWIGKHQRPICMLCTKNFGMFSRRHNCHHCGRICCNDCSNLFIELYYFPHGFPGRVGNNSKPSKDLQEVCKTCYNILNAREKEEKKKKGNGFVNRIIGIEWDEMRDSQTLP